MASPLGLPLKCTKQQSAFCTVSSAPCNATVPNGFNVYPREVEEVIYAHPAVAEAAVIGIPDERLGEEVKAVVALKPGAKATEEEIIAFVKERVATYKYPRTVQFVASLPKGATGKILKKELKAQLELAAKAWSGILFHRV